MPAAVNSVDVFLVGGGAGGRSAGGYYKAGSGGGYTKTFRGTGYTRPSSGTWSGSYYNGRDGNAVSVTPGTAITIIVGSGGAANQAGSYSQFLNSNYVAEGGEVGGRKNSSSSTGAKGGNGGSGGGANGHDGGIDGDDGWYYTNNESLGRGECGYGQGHTTRDFGESSGTPNAAGSFGDGGGYSSYNRDKQSHSEGSGDRNSNSGYGGAGYSYDGNSGGGDGTVLVRYYGYR